MSDVRDRWTTAAAYEDFMGRWSRRLAPQFLTWLGPPAGLHWLDLGCGTGALSAAICAQAAPASVLGCDPSAGFIAAARERMTDPRARFASLGADHRQALARRLEESLPRDLAGRIGLSARARGVRGSVR